jgi:hypothetical protein
MSLGKILSWLYLRHLLHLRSIINEMFLFAEKPLASAFAVLRVRVYS